MLSKDSYPGSGRLFTDEELSTLTPEQVKELRVKYQGIFKREKAAWEEEQDALLRKRIEPEELQKEREQDKASGKPCEDKGHDQCRAGCHNH